MFLVSLDHNLEAVEDFSDRELCVSRSVRLQDGDRDPGVVWMCAKSAEGGVNGDRVFSVLYVKVVHSSRGIFSEALTQ